jgi:hypothetical protein
VLARAKIYIADILALSCLLSSCYEDKYPVHTDNVYTPPRTGEQHGFFETLILTICCIAKILNTANFGPILYAVVLLKFWNIVTFWADFSCCKDLAVFCSTKNVY